ncbi:transmembrane protein sting isoform 2-T3 [Cochliomyia hominivorax]
MHVLPNTICKAETVTISDVKPFWKRKMHFLIEYMEQSLHIMSVVMVAEILRRTCRIFYEYLNYSNYYYNEDKLWTITKRSFGMNLSTSIGLIVFLCVALVCIVGRDSWPPLHFFAFMPWYWIFMALAMHSSYLNYADWIREPHGLDYAEGMASNYFHGYLKLILPTHAGGIKERMALYENQHKVKFASKRLFILVPNTMFINSKIESEILTEEAPLNTVIKNRAGVARPYKNDVFRLNINNAFYYVAMEGATPMLSFFEALNFQPSTTWQMKEMKREILLKFCKHLKYLLNKWPETEGRAEVILYNSK